MTAPSFCTLSGLVYANGAVVENAMVRITISGPNVGLGTPVGDGHHRGQARTVYTDSNGAWSMSLPQGVYFRVEIPGVFLDAVGTVPSSSTSDLINVSLTDYRTWSYSFPEIL